MNVNVNKKIVIEMLRGWEIFHQALDSDRKWSVHAHSLWWQVTQQMGLLHFLICGQFRWCRCQKGASPELLEFSNRGPFKRSFHLAADLLILFRVSAVCCILMMLPWIVSNKKRSGTRWRRDKQPPSSLTLSLDGMIQQCRDGGFGLTLKWQFSCNTCQQPDANFMLKLSTAISDQLE